MFLSDANIRRLAFILLACSGALILAPDNDSY